MNLLVDCSLLLSGCDRIGDAWIVVASRGLSIHRIKKSYTVIKNCFYKLPYLIKDYIGTVDVD